LLPFFFAFSRPQPFAVRGRFSQTVRMKYALTICLLLIATVLSPVGSVRAQPAPAKAMSAIDIVEALVSADPALRDRGALELTIMSAQTGQALGAEIIRVEVREAEIALRRVGVAGNAASATAACCALDSNEEVVRIAALDALIAMKPASVSEGGTKHMTAARLQIVRQLIAESDYIKQHCEAAQEGFDGQVAPPTRKALALTILLDRFFGVKGMPMLMRRVSGYMLGEEPADEQKKTPHRRSLDERLRRGAAMWCEAIWIEDPAIKFNFSPIAPYNDRAKAVARIDRLLGDMESREVTHGDVKFAGWRYGDFLYELLQSDVRGIQAAAFLRMQWWGGEQVVICGDGYAETVDEYAKMRRGEKSAIKARVTSWWLAYRAATD
jgi:hypothetical protein